VTATGEFRERLSKVEVCRGFSHLAINPGIHFGELDYDTITDKGALADPSGRAPSLRPTP
jgi:hypothetical protein